MRRVDSLEKTDAGRDWGQKEKGMTEDKMAGCEALHMCPRIILKCQKVKKLSSPAFIGRFFTIEPQGKPIKDYMQ